jgi:hypothetical protein
MYLSPLYPLFHYSFGDRERFSPVISKYLFNEKELMESSHNGHTAKGTISKPGLFSFLTEDQSTMK